MKRLTFFSGKRGGFSHLVPVIEACSADSDLEVSLIAADMHMVSGFGNTIDEVRRHVPRTYTVETTMASDSRLARAKSIGLALQGVAELLGQIDPDLLFVLGDRGEVLGATIAAIEMNIPVVHLFGGDICQGGVDEPVRHAITKLAAVHLTSNADSAARVRALGEEPWRVHDVGSPVLDLIAQGRFTPGAAVRSKLGLDPEGPVVVLLQHSVTWQVESAGAQMRETMEALGTVACQTVAVYPCSDPGYRAVIDELERCRQFPWLRIFRNIDHEDFLGLLSTAAVLVGNSSSGIMEAASFGLPVVNIGIRQEDRLRAGNVTDVDHDRVAIADAIRRAIGDAAFREAAARCRNPYGDGQASRRIRDVLSSLPGRDTLIRKRMPRLVYSDQEERP